MKLLPRILFLLSLSNYAFYFSDAFTVRRSSTTTASWTSSSSGIISPRNKVHGGQDRKSTALAATPKYNMPSQQESEDLGIREWSQQTKSSSWTDEATEGQTLVRYILQGSGVLYVDGESSKKFNVGMLVEVEGPVKLDWEKDVEEDVIILTPGYESGGLFAGALVGFVAMVGALVALT